MKRIGYIVSVIASLTVLVFMPYTTFAASAEFTDVGKGNDHYDSIHWLVKEGIITGYEDGTFKPGNSLTRMHAAKLFAEALKLNLPAAKEAENYFDDVNENSQYAREIAAVAEAKIFTGENRIFGAESNLTREQMATVLVRAFKLESGTNEANITLTNVSDSHKAQVQTLANLGITKVTDNFRPAEAVSRGQFASFLYRSMNLDTVPDDSEEVKPPSGPTIKIVKQSYNTDFATVLNKQMNVSPQTDAKGKWYHASNGMVEYHANPANFKQGTDSFYQFLKLSGTSGVTAKELNSVILNGKGILAGEGNSFVKASKTHNVNEIYLISHAFLETGNGTSALAKGVEVGENKSGNPVMVTEKNRKDLKNIRVTYNMFGIGAVDRCPLTCGSERAYSEGWFTPEAAIVGGAGFIAKNYIQAGQDTLYKMRWNPASPASHQYATDVGWAVKQTARYKTLFDSFNESNNLTLTFEVPSYSNQPAAKSKPTGAAVFHVNKNHKYAGKSATVTADALNFRTGPTTDFSVIKKLPQKTKVTVIGENSGWYKIKSGNDEGWVSGDYLDFGDKKAVLSSFTVDQAETNAEEPKVIGEVLEDTDNAKAGSTIEILDEKSGAYKTKDGWVDNDAVEISNIRFVKQQTEVKQSPAGDTIGTVRENENVIIVPNDKNELTKDGQWIKIYYNGKIAWISDDAL